MAGENNNETLCSKIDFVIFVCLLNFKIITLHSYRLFLLERGWSTLLKYVGIVVQMAMKIII